MVAPLPAPPPGSPTAPTSGDPTAVFGRRVVAFLIDTVVVGGPGLALAGSRFESYDARDAGLSGTDFCDAYLDQASGGACFNLNDTVYFSEGGFDPVSLAPLLFSVLLFVVVQGLTGWTVGKLALGLRTVREDGSAPGLGKAFLRWLLLIVDSLPCLGLVGLITAGTSTGHRRVGDMAAKTYVVRAAAAGAPVLIPGSAAIPATGPYASAPAPWPAPAASPSPAAPAPSEARWDEARGAYIQWDATRNRWLQWDQAAGTWDEIPGQ